MNVNEKIVHKIADQNRKKYIKNKVIYENNNKNTNF